MSNPASVSSVGSNDLYLGMRGAGGVQCVALPGASVVLRYQLVHAESGWAEGIPQDGSWACGGPLELPACWQQRSASDDRVARWLGQTVAALTGEVLRDERVAIVSVEIAIEAVGAAQAPFVLRACT